MHQGSCLTHLPCLSKFSGLDQYKSPWSKCHLRPRLTDSHLGALSFFPLSDPITLASKPSTATSTSTSIATAWTTEHKNPHTLKTLLAQLPCAPRRGWHGRNIHYFSHQSMPTNTAQKIFLIIFIIINETPVCPLLLLPDAELAQPSPAALNL